MPVTAPTPAPPARAARPPPQVLGATSAGTASAAACRKPQAAPTPRPAGAGGRGAAPASVSASTSSGPARGGADTRPAVVVGAGRPAPDSAASGRCRRQVVDRGAHHRMAEPPVPVQVDKADRFRGFQGVTAQPHPGECGSCVLPPRVVQAASTVTAVREAVGSTSSPPATDRATASPTGSGRASRPEASSRSITSSGGPAGGPGPRSASCVASMRTISCSASGLPRAVRSTASRTSGSRRSVISSVSSAALASGSSACRLSTGIAASSGGSPPTSGARTTNTKPTRAWLSRRAANASAASDSWSAQWASSTTISSGSRCDVLPSRSRTPARTASAVGATAPRGSGLASPAPGRARGRVGAAGWRAGPATAAGRPAGRRTSGLSRAAHVRSTVDRGAATALDQPGFPDPAPPVTTIEVTAPRAADERLDEPFPLDARPPASMTTEHRRRTEGAVPSRPVSAPSRTPRRA